MKEFEEFKFHGYILNQIKITENGVAHVYVDKAAIEEFGLSYEQASACVSHMDSIKDSLIWVAFIESGKGDEIRVRLRSRFITVNALAEQYEGGGHACACGATVHSVEQMQEFVEKADAMLNEYKSTHEGWL